MLHCTKRCGVRVAVRRFAAHHRLTTLRDLISALTTLCDLISVMTTLCD
jgi:hypothetical protein